MATRSVSQQLHLKADLLASVVMFFVAMPLCIGIALACGVPPAAGIVSAVIGGIVCGALSGAPLVVSGPAAGLAAMVYQIVLNHGLHGLAMITVFAGVLQMAMGRLRLGYLFKKVPSAVIHGMLSVIGFIIAILQLHVLLGSTVPTSLKTAVTTLPSVFSRVEATTIMCGVLAIAIQLGWPHGPKSWRWLPGALPAMMIAGLVSLFFEMPRVDLGSVSGDVMSALNNFTFPSVDHNLGALLFAALGLAFVASAESLLTAIAVDHLRMTSRPDETPAPPADLDKELFAQGVSNSIVGFLGGVPITGVIVRSAANVTSGAKTRAATMLHGLWIGVFALAFPWLLEKLPLTVLAAVLVVTGFKLTNIKGLVHEWKTSKFLGSIWLVTFVGVLTTDLLKGLALGIAVALVGQWAGQKLKLK
jgi:carbonic anhydrase